MTNNPLVSIIIPIYNVENYLSKCLDSVVNQTYKNIEILCVNDGSTDNSINILGKYNSIDARIQIITQKNGGLATARNTGLKYAKGDYVYFLDSDDWIDINLIQTTLDAIILSDADICMFDACNVYGESYVNVKRVSNFIAPKSTKVMNYKDDSNIRDLQCTAWSKLYKKSFLETNNLQFPDGVRFGEDVPFWFELLLKNPKIVFINKFLYFYRKREASLTAKTQELIDKQWNVYLECKKIPCYKTASVEEKLYILDYNTRMAVYNFSTTRSLKLLVQYEKSLKNFSDEYKQYKACQLFKLRGFRLLKTRYIYLVGKYLVLEFLKLSHKRRNK